MSMTHWLIYALAAFLPWQADEARQQKDVAPAEFKVKAVSPERSIAEFMDVCFRPMLDADATQAAISKSEFAYRRDPPPDPKYPGSFRWRSPRGYIALELWEGGEQCESAGGSIQPRTDAELLAVLQPAIEAELKHPVTLKTVEGSPELSCETVDGCYYVSIWRAAGSHAEAAGKAGRQQGHNFLFDRRGRAATSKQCELD